MHLGRHFLAGCLAAVTVLVAGCASEEQIGGAIGDVNKEFQAEYEAILAQQGTRIYKLGQAAAFSGVRSALIGLGMTVETQDQDLGYLNFYAPAPRPLYRDEWRRAAETDLPRMREIARKRVGMMSDFIRFEPEGLQIVINATMLEVKSGTEISLTMRMREVAPPKSGMPRREYAPPTGVRMGLDKIWRAIDHELSAAGGASSLRPQF